MLPHAGNLSDRLPPSRADSSSCTVVHQFEIRGGSSPARRPCDTPVMATRPKRPADFAQRAKLIIDIATGQVPPDPPIAPESARAKVGRKGGLKGGKARAKALSPTRRKTIARKAASARWKR